MRRHDWSTRFTAFVLLLSAIWFGGQSTGSLL